MLEHRDATSIAWILGTNGQRLAAVVERWGIGNERMCTRHTRVSERPRWKRRSGSALRTWNVRGLLHRHTRHRRHRRVQDGITHVFAHGRRIRRVHRRSHPHARDLHDANRRRLRRAKPCRMSIARSRVEQKFWWHRRRHNHVDRC